MKIYIIIVSFLVCMTMSSGCATHRVVNDYGKVSAYYNFYGPAYGNTNRLYVQGTKTISRNLGKDKSYPVYIVADIKEGKTISISKPKRGSVPRIALEYPEIKPNINNNIYYASAKRTFVQSGKDSDAYFNTFFFKNNDDVDNPFAIQIKVEGESYRSTASYVLFPFVFTGALVVDFVTSPLQLCYIWAFNGMPVIFMPHP